MSIRFEGLSVEIKFGIGEGQLEEKLNSEGIGGIRCEVG
jgi:hypothetical protein